MTGPSGMFQVTLELLGLFAKRGETVLPQEEKKGHAGDTRQLGGQARGQLAGLVELQSKEEARLLLELFGTFLQGPENFGRIGDGRVCHKIPNAPGYPGSDATVAPRAAGRKTLPERSPVGTHGPRQRGATRTMEEVARQIEVRLMAKAQKIVSLRLEADEYNFIRNLVETDKEDLSTALRDLVARGRVLLALERYRDGKASLSKASEVAGLSVSVARPEARRSRSHCY